MARWRERFVFPNPVNEIAARCVAAGVVALSLAYVVTASGWLLVPLTYGFVARVAAGPTFSPLGRFVTGIVVPRLPVAPRLVAGPPKRFAQGIGATLSLAAAVVHGFGGVLGAQVLVAIIVAAASLEAGLGYCLGCKMYGLLMRFGMVAETACADCADLSRRLPVRAA